MIHQKQKTYHQIITFLLLLTFSFQAMLYWPLALIKKEMAKEEMFEKIKHKVPEKLLVSIHDNNSILWENTDEFEYKGKMYDVVRISASKNGTKIYHCINDDKENAIIKELEKRTNKNSEERRSSNKINLDFCAMIDSKNTESFFALNFAKQSIFYFNNQYYFNPYLKIAQPPKIA